MSCTLASVHEQCPTVTLFWAFLRFVLKGFSKEGRDLTDAETTAFLNAADKDGDGKIGIDGERKEEHFKV